MENMDSKDQVKWLKKWTLLIDSGKASVDGDAIVIDVTDLGFDKVLAKGNITKVFKISSPKFSASAVEKIEELGGEAIEL